MKSGYFVMGYFVIELLVLLRREVFKCVFQFNEKINDITK
jgi:hypothetical protein